MLWCLSPNFGDELAPYLARRAGKEPAYTLSPGRYVLSGSMLNNCTKNDTAWGCGIAHEQHRVPAGITILSVRGPKSLYRAREHNNNVPEVIADSGFILPRIYTNSLQGENLEGEVIVPHYVDFEKLTAANPNKHVVNILDPVEKVLDQILAAEIIRSSSLHGLVVAAAYGRKFQWIPSALVNGVEYKYDDFYQSMGLKLSEDVVSCPESKQLDLIQIASQTFPFPEIFKSKAV